MSAERAFTSEEKRRFLAAYGDALTNAPDTIEVFLEVIGVTHAQLSLWQWQLDHGELVGDGEQDVPVLVGDGSILALGRMLRSVLTQARPREPIRPDSAAAKVVYDDAGRWRIDYLARARSALKAVFDTFAIDPGSVISPNKPTTPGQAVAAVRASWGIDHLPRITWEDDVNSDSADRRVDRWAETMTGNPIAYEALRTWYRSRPDTEAVRPASASEKPPVWMSRADMWPPSEEGRWVRDLARKRLGDLPDLAAVIGEDCQLSVVRRLTVAKVDAYVQLSEGYGGMKIFFQQHVVRPWQGYTMMDLRTAKEKATGIAPRLRDEQIVAAVVSMCLHTAINDWDAAAAQQAIDRIYALQRPGSSDRPEMNYRARAVAIRQAQARFPKIQELPNKERPLYVAQAHPRVFDLFCAAELLQLAPGSTYAVAYVDTRRRVMPEMVKDDRNRMVSILADLTANLAIAPRRVRDSLDPGTVAAIRGGLRRNSQSTAFGAALQRNEALGRQNIDYEGAVASGVQGLNRIRALHQSGNARDRDMLIMEEQLELNLAGSAVQWVEQLLAGEEGWQRAAVPDGQWERFSNFAVHHATNAVALIEMLLADGHLEGKRYNDGFLADANFVYTAHDILYRCTGAAAVAALTFPFGEPDRSETLLAQLEEVHLGVTTIVHPIAQGGLPRLMHSMLLHTFLMGGVLPALQYENLNLSLFDKDAITRVLDEKEIGDPRARTEMTYNRIALLTDWLIGRNWNAGWIGSVAEGSPVWNTLETRSGGLYSKWRKDFGELLLGAHAPDGTRPSSANHSFHVKGPIPKNLDTEDAPRISRSDWNGGRDDHVPPAYPTAS
ncbi:hypothetical protein [Microbacterium sp. LB12]|uniref:hypothetical protein n=3 Tax=unclassified Microbacterium TaxID=2609290 RepID=UPI00301602ED